MYQWGNMYHVFTAHYLENCKHKWAVQEHKKVNGEWIKKSFKRFDDLAEVRKYVFSMLEQE